MSATAAHFRLPSLSWRFASVWSQISRVWRKLALPSLLGNLADPMIYLLGLGCGLGALVKTVDGVPYVPGRRQWCASRHEYRQLRDAVLRLFAHMHVQRTWEG